MISFINRTTFFRKSSKLCVDQIISQKTIYKTLERHAACSTVFRNVSHQKVLQRNIHGSTGSSAPTAANVQMEEENPKHISEMPGLGYLEGLYKTIFHMKPANIHHFWMGLCETYGPIFKLDLIGNPHMVMTTDPDDFDKVLRHTQDNPMRVGLYSLKDIRHNTMNNYFEKKGGIFIENGEEWWRVRKEVQTPMMKPKNIIKYLNGMDDIALEFIERIVSFQKELGEMPSNFQLELYKWALESVSTVTLNRRLGCLKSDLPSDSTQVDLINIVNNLFEHMADLEMSLPIWRLYKTKTYKALDNQHEKFFRIVEKYLSEAEEELKVNSLNSDDAKDKTLLQILLENDKLSRKDILTFILDLCFAGIDTTSHTMGFTLYLLAKNPEKQRKVQEEVDRVIGTGEQALNENHLAGLTYLKNCIKESQRLFPITIGTMRMLEKDLVLQGYNIPKGHQVLLFTYASQRNESLFSRASEFLPERWDRSHPMGSIHPFASLPFSHGTRMCVGRRIAEQEMYLLMARIMKRFNVEYKYKDMGISNRLVSVPTEPLRFEFHERT